MKSKRGIVGESLTDWILFVLFILAALASVYFLIKRAGA